MLSRAPTAQEIAGTSLAIGCHIMTIGGSSLGDLYLERHRVFPPGVLDDELVLPVLRRRDFHRTLRAGRVVLADLLAGLVVDVQVHVGVLRAVRGSLKRSPRREGQQVGDLALVLHLDLLALELRPLAQVGGHFLKHYHSRLFGRSSVQAISTGVISMDW